MNILTTRFGLIQACETDVITIPEGLLGFRSFIHYTLLPDPVVMGLSWLQSLTAPGARFRPGRTADGGRRLPDRDSPGGPRGTRAGRRTIRHDLRDLEPRRRGGLTVNLQGPLVFNPIRRLGRQLVLTSSRYPVRYPIDPGATAQPPTCCPGRLRCVRRRNSCS